MQHCYSFCCYHPIHPMLGLVWQMLFHSQSLFIELSSRQSIDDDVTINMICNGILCSALPKVRKGGERRQGLKSVFYRRYPVERFRSTRYKSTPSSMNCFVNCKIKRPTPKHQSQWHSHYHQNPRAFSATIESWPPQQACVYPLSVWAR